MPADRVARERYEARQLLAARTTRAALAAWGRVDLDDIAASWAREVPELTVRVAVAQRTTAAAAETYVAAALAEQGLTSTGDGELVASALAGVASDGRSLGTLVAEPAIRVLEQIAIGADANVALGAGRNLLTMIVATQVADAGRVADGIAITTRPRVGYVRQLNPPSCSRCAVLAGAFYRWNAGFDRHPRCDCTHIPVAENFPGDATTDPRGYFDSLSADEQNRIFTNAGAASIRDGADIGQVVNARRGMSAAGTTTEGTTRRGLAGRRLGTDARLMPEQIYELADGDRDVAVDLLRQHGFIV